MTASIGAKYKLIETLFAKKTKKKTYTPKILGGSASMSSMAGMFQNISGSTSVLQLTVKKMQNAINIQPNMAGLQSLSPTSTIQAYVPSRAEIDNALHAAGGRDAVNPWLVDGKTKIMVDGRKTVVDVTGQSASQTADGTQANPHSDLVQSIARFGLDGESLNGGADELRAKLREAANKAAADQPSLSPMIEYALEDAFAKVAAWEASGSKTSGTATAANDEYSQQRETNLQQAESIIQQLNLGASQSWGITSMAEDLAVFGKDMTALKDDPRALAKELRGKSKDMLAELDARYVGTEAEYISKRNLITGACARLANGLEGAGLIASTTASASWSIGTSALNTGAASVSVGGVQINASVVVAVSNVIVDPLVLDLNGDGINLSAAEEGVDFDMDGDGQANRSGFIRGDDAFLFMDTHGDGLAHDGRQLFGNSGGYANGFDMLAQYDDNGDGVIDENDAVYDKLMVWQEKTENGVCEEDETMTLREAGIKSIDLGYKDVREDDGKGNLVGQTGSFTRDDGSAGYAADVWLRELQNRP